MSTFIPYVHYDWDIERSHRFDLKPTGRWKVEVYKDRSVLYIEHKHRFRKEWIREEYICFREEPDVFINNCNG